MTVTWPRLNGVAGYRVKVTASDGRREVHFRTATKRSVRILTVAPKTTVKVNVAGWIGTRRLTGPARSASLAAHK